MGTFAVQIAKSLSADHVIDYKKEGYTEGGVKYDLIIDMVSLSSRISFNVSKKINKECWINMI